MIYQGRELTILEQDPLQDFAKFIKEILSISPSAKGNEYSQPVKTLT